MWLSPCNYCCTADAKITKKPSWLLISVHWRRHLCSEYCAGRKDQCSATRQTTTALIKRPLIARVKMQPIVCIGTESTNASSTLQQKPCWQPSQILQPACSWGGKPVYGNPTAETLCCLWWYTGKLCCLWYSGQLYKRNSCVETLYKKLLCRNSGNSAASGAVTCLETPWHGASLAHFVLMMWW